MKITIDTKEDSHEEISKVISLLQNMLDSKPQHNQDMFAPNETAEPVSSPPPSSGGMFGMFGDNSPSTPSEQPDSDVAPDDSQDYSDDTEDNPEEEQSDPEIITY